MKFLQERILNTTLRPSICFFIIEAGQSMLLWRLGLQHWPINYFQKNH